MNILKVKKSSMLGVDMSGTQMVKGFKIILYPDNMNAVNEKYTIMASEGVKVKQAPLLKFFTPVATIDESGKANGVKMLTDLTDKLQCLAGKKWTY